MFKKTGEIKVSKKDLSLKVKKGSSQDQFYTIDDLVKDSEDLSQELFEEIRKKAETPKTPKQ